MGRPTPQGLGWPFPSTMALPFFCTLPPPGLTLGLTWFHHLRFSLILLLGPPVGTAGGTTVIPQGNLCTSVILLPLTSPILILRPAFYSLEEGSTDMHNMVLDPIVWNLGLSVWVHCITQKVRGVQVTKSPTSKRLNNLHPEGFDYWCPMALVPGIIAEGHVLQSMGILQYHPLLEVQFLMGVMIDLVVVSLYDVGCWWANINILPSLLVGPNKAPQADHPHGQLLVVHGAGTP